MGYKGIYAHICTASDIRCGAFYMCHMPYLCKKEVSLLAVEPSESRVSIYDGIIELMRLTDRLYTTERGAIHTSSKSALWAV